MPANPKPAAVLLDCLGTLLEFVPPAPRLAAAVGIPLAEAEERMRAEIAYYRAHMHTATDATALAALRERCAAIAGCDVATLVDDVIAFRPFPEVVDVLGELRRRGAKLVVVSNWDVSLHEVLARTGITPLIDDAVSSAEMRSAKPHPGLVRAALEMARVDARDAVLAGDSAEDVEAAAAAGVRALRLDRPRVDLRALLWETG